MQTQAPEDNVVLMRRRAEISGDALLKSAAALRLHAEDSAQCQYLLHSKSARLLSQAADEIERLRHDIERHIAMASELATENERLREYARHDPSCKSWGRIPCPCDCGYDELMKELEESK